MRRGVHGEVGTLVVELIESLDHDEGVSFFGVALLEFETTFDTALKGTELFEGVGVHFVFLLFLFEQKHKYYINCQPTLLLPCCYPPPK